MSWSSPTPGGDEHREPASGPGEIDAIRHVVVVRFSQRVPEWHRRTFVDERNREEWFKYRAALYRQTLGPSMRCQTKKVEGVYVLMDTDDQALYRDYLDDGTVIPIYGRERDQERVAEDMLRRGWRRQVAISRIDSDDIVAKDYMRRLDEQIVALREAGGRPELIVACMGYRTNFAQIQRTCYESSPFITRYFETYSGGGAYTMAHQEVHSVPHASNYTAEWMQVIHGTNVANGFMKPKGPMPTPEEIRAGMAVTNSSPLAPVDPRWFAEWAGFALPDPAIFRAAPVHSWRQKLRLYLRRVKGKI
jgi:hypothetical protein